MKFLTHDYYALQLYAYAHVQFHVRCSFATCVLWTVALLHRAGRFLVLSWMKGDKKSLTRSFYLSFTAGEKAEVAKHGSTYGFRAAIKHFSKKFGKDLKQNTISEWIKVYINKLGQKRTSMDTSAGHVTLRAKKRCREQVTCDSSLSFVYVIFAALPSLLFSSFRFHHFYPRRVCAQCTCYVHT